MKRFCKDCKHYDPIEETHWCARDVTQVVCLVTGETKNTNTFKFCKHEREMRGKLLGIKTGYCGKEGVYFESKHNIFDKVGVSTKALEDAIEEYNKFVGKV